MKRTEVAGRVCAVTVVLTASAAWLLGCNPTRRNGFGTQADGGLPSNQQPTCFSTGSPAPWQDSFSLPGAKATVTDRGTMLLGIMPGLYANTAFYTKAAPPGFHDSWYGAGISATWDVQASGVDVKSGALIAPAFGEPLAVNFGGTIKTYEPWPALPDGGTMAGYKSMWHDDSVVSFTDDPNNPLLITLANGTNLLFDTNGWLTQECRDPKCTYPLRKYTRDATTQQLKQIDDYSVGQARTTTLNWSGNSFQGFSNAATSWSYQYAGNSTGYTITVTPPKINGAASNSRTVTYVGNTDPQTETLSVVSPAGAKSSFTLENQGGCLTKYNASDARQNLSLVAADLSKVATQTSYTYVDQYQKAFTLTHCNCPAGSTSTPFVDDDGGAAVCGTAPVVGNTTAFVDQAGFTHLTQYTADGKVVAQNDPVAPGKDLFRVVAWSPDTSEWSTSIKMENYNDPQTYTVDESHQGRILTAESPTHVVTQVTAYADDSKWYAYNLPQEWSVTGATIKSPTTSVAGGVVGTKFVEISDMKDAGIITTTIATSDCPGCTHTTSVTIPTPTQGIVISDSDYSSQTQETCSADGTMCKSQLVGSQFFVNENYGPDWQLTSVNYNDGEPGTENYAWVAPGLPASFTNPEGLTLTENWDTATRRNMGSSIGTGTNSIDTSVNQYANEPEIVAAVVPNGFLDEVDLPAEPQPNGAVNVGVESLDNKR